MKLGIRTPSIKRSIQARTTGRVKRAVKKTVNPFYGKKGMGYVSNPKRAIYNKVYNKTSFSVFDLIKPKNTSKSSVSSTFTADDLFTCKYVLSDNGIYCSLAVLCILGGLLLFALGNILLIIFDDSIFIKICMYLPFIMSILLFVKSVHEGNKNQQVLEEISNIANRSIDKESFSNLNNEMIEYLENAMTSLNSMITTVDVDVFFAEYKFLNDQLEQAIKIENVFIFPNGTPSEILKNIRDEYTNIANEFIERLYSITAEKIRSLKTIKARQNHANKFNEQFSEYVELFTQLNKDRIIELHKSLMEECFDS